MNKNSRTDRVELPPDDSPGFWIRNTHLTVVKALRQRLQSHGISPSQWYVLRILWITEGLSQKELSTRVGTTEPTTLNALRLMERNGLVRRKKNSKDRRTKNIYLTRKGRGLESQLMPYAVDVNRVAVGSLSKSDIAVFRRTLAEIRKNLNADLKETGAANGQKRK